MMMRSAMLVLVTEGTHGALDMGGVDHRIDLVSFGEMIVTGRHEEVIVARDADADQMKIGEQIGELAERRIEDWAILRRSAPRSGERWSVGKGDDRGGARHFEAGGDRFRDLAFRRDDEVDRQMLAPEEILPASFQIALLADARDLDGHVEDRMGHLTGDHVDLVVMGDGDQEFGILRSCLSPEHVRVRSVAGDRLNIQAFADFLALAPVAGRSP